jgi:hypothetical protein
MESHRLHGSALLEMSTGTHLTRVAGVPLCSLDAHIERVCRAPALRADSATVAEQSRR